MTDDITDVTDAANTVERRLDPVLVAKLVTWRDTELGQYEEEAVKDLGRHVV